jgi:hypothetical protein
VADPWHSGSAVVRNDAPLPNDYAEVVTLREGVVVVGPVLANQGTPAVPANAWPVTLYDAAGNQIAVLDGAVIAPTQRGIIIAAQDGGGLAQFLEARTAAPAAGDLGLVTRTVPQPGVDIGDVTVNNAAGAAAVNIQDGGNSISVDFPPAGVDVFGRLRTSNPQTIFDSKQIADNQPLFWDDAVLSGAGTSSTFNTNQASTTLAVSNLTAGSRARQTFRSFNYQPGKSALIFMTFVGSALAAGITRRVGQFNANNGLFLETSGTTLNFVRRTFTSGVAVDNTVAQAAWNLDKLNGTGASGITLDTTKTQILVIDYEWLGVGVVRFGFVFGGMVIYAHVMYHSNVLSLVYMSLPNLPLRYEITNSGAGPAASLTHICSTVISEGGRQETGLTFAAARGDTALTTINNNSLYPLVAIRLKAAYQFAQVTPIGLSVVVTSTASYQWVLLLNPTVVGTALAFASITNSAVEAEVAATNATTVTGGTALASGYGQAAATGETNVPLTNELLIGASIAGVSDILVLAVRRLTGTGTAETFYGAITWQEAQ